MCWYVLRTKPRQEARAITNLENQQFEVYCPWLIRKNGKEEALFPGYLFVRLSAFERSYSSLYNTRGVLNIVKFGEHWPTVNDTLIEFLKSHEGQRKGISLFKKEQAVVIQAGPFRGIEAVYLCANGESRAMVLIEILHRKQKLLIEEQMLKAI